jgi:hypothetical protein
MHKIFLAVSSMIVAGFLMKSYRKLREKPEPELDELHRRMRAAHEAHREIERLRAAARPTLDTMGNAVPEMAPGDGGLMSAIDSLQQMAPGRFS